MRKTIYQHKTGRARVTVDAHGRCYFRPALIWLSGGEITRAQAARILLDNRRIMRRDSEEGDAA